MSSTQIISGILLIIIPIIGIGRGISPVFPENGIDRGVTIKNRLIVKMLIGRYRKSNKKGKGLIYVRFCDEDKMSYVAVCFYLTEAMLCVGVILGRVDIVIIPLIGILFGFVDLFIYRKV